MIQAREERLYQARLIDQICRLLSLYQISTDRLTLALGIDSEQWERFLTCTDPMTAYHVSKCADTIGTSIDQLLPDVKVVKRDLLMAMANDLPSDLFDKLFYQTVALLQVSAQRGHLPPR